MDAEKDALIAALRDEIERLKQAAMDDTAALDGAMLVRNLVGAQQAEKERRRRIDGYRIPDRVYEMLEDMGLLVAARAALDRMWHQNDVREVNRQLGEVLRKFRERMHENL